MLLLVEIILLMAALGLLIPSAFLLLECLAAWLSDRPSVEESASPPVKVAVLIPAHNEAFGIGTTLEHLLPQVCAPENLVVIADNCTDNTAAIARQYGVTVIERQDSQRRGKGYAVDYGVRFLEGNPPEIVVLVDADCSVTPKTIDRIARLAKSVNRPVQATYLMEQPANPSSKDIISALAVKVKNLVRPYGLLRLGLPCLLMGSGMAFPWELIRQANLANNKTTDDMQLCVDLATVGYPPLYCPQGRVTGRLMELEAAKSQRSRWEHGHIDMLLTQSPRLIKAALSQRRYDLVGLALELCVPPLSLLVMLWLAATLCAFLATAFGVSWIPSALLGIAGLAIAIATVLSWAKFGREDISGRSLLTIPFYILWKIPLYIAFLIQPQNKWLKTERD
jgi:cellulose synthase/poly-beta-1,6-N-acetylglucosamine synthase-like glycosyltransferase